MSIKKSLYQETERRLYTYHSMRKEIEAYEDSCIDRRRPPTGESIRGTYISDPTAKNGLALAEPPEWMAEKRKWVKIITDAWAEMRCYNPELAQICETYYGLENGVRRKEKEAITRRLMEGLHISRDTVYRRRQACVHWVKEIAIFNGLLDPTMEISDTNIV